MNDEEVMIPKSYHDKVCEEIIRFKDKQFYDAVHLLDDGTLEITVGDYTKVKRVLVEDCNNFGNLFYENDTDRPQGWIPCSERLPDLNENGVSDMVLLCWSDGQMTVGAYQGDRTFVGQAWPTARDCRVTVTAWQSLPKPWKGADDE